MLLEETFYITEYGFNFTVKTGLDLTNFVTGDIKAVIRRPDKSVSVKSISISNILDLTTGTVLFPVGDKDLTIEGRYQAQVFARHAALAVGRPSHVFEFDVASPIGESINFPWT